ncbi:MAG: PLP-dependent aminotransferase family protein, partial [Clostridia bacterium]|nr:PLP-dependent aminotransferase family protein [Clostridia bacterium]
MKYVVEKNKNTPAYLQLYRQVRDDILNESYPYNSKLSSKRTIAEEMGLSTVTVEHAYGLLADEGYIEARERSGYFVIFRTDDGFVSAAKGETRHIFPSVPHSTAWEEFPFSVLAKTMRTVISNMGRSILDRSPNLGCLELRRAIQNYLARSRGIKADASQIVIGSGSEYLYSLIVELLGRDKVFAIEAPSYKKIEQVYSAANVQLKKLPLGEDGIDSASLKACKANVLHISPYRSYPSGVTATASKR